MVFVLYLIVFSVAMKNAAKVIFFLCFFGINISLSVGL